MRGLVEEAASGAFVMRTRSPQLADVIARLLNGESVPPRAVADPSGLPRYSASRDASSARGLIYSAASTARSPAAFGDGVIVVSEDRALADRVASMLNEIDPEPRRRVTRGFGWW